jgi:hypothetical protein
MKRSVCLGRRVQFLKNFLIFWQCAGARWHAAGLRESGVPGEARHMPGTSVATLPARARRWRAGPLPAARRRLHELEPDVATAINQKYRFRNKRRARRCCVRSASTTPCWSSSNGA